MRRLILKSFQSPGDILVLTATVRELHHAHPGEFQTDVRTSADAIWQNNPFLTKLEESQADVEHLMMHYPLINQSNQSPYHFLHGYVQYLEQHLGVRIPLTRFKGDIHLSNEEKNAPCPGLESGVPESFWIIIAGGKYDFTAKWWSPASYQRVVDHFQGRITFVQCGEQGHWHKPLLGAINLVGKTGLRDFIRLMYHADGVVCPVTFAMHLAAAVETKPGRSRCRPCVVIAGGREPPHWEAYPQHQFISTVGTLSCCAEGGCWKSRCQLVGDGDEKDRHNLCDQPIQIAADLRIPRCMDMITPDEVIRRIELYYDGGILKTQNGCRMESNMNTASNDTHEPEQNSPKQNETHILIKFTHGLGDAMQVTTILQHLAHYHPDWKVDVASLIGKHSVFHGLCNRSIIIDRQLLALTSYHKVYDLRWQECSTCYADCPSTKAERCLQEVFGLTPLAELCTYKINISEHAKDLARQYFEEICGCKAGKDGRFRAVLIHYEGNNSAEHKNIPVEMARRLCELIIDHGFAPVVLDWDYRTPLADGKRIHNPNVKSTLWSACGNSTGDAEVIAALISAATLMIGIDSGPLHIAGALTTPTIGIWTGHHPLHYFGLADNVTHLVPENHVQLLRGDRAFGDSFFNQRYRFETYQDLWKALASMVPTRLVWPFPEKALVVTGPGLGDALQATAVITHLKHYNPKWLIEVVTGKGKGSAFTGLADTVWLEDGEKPNRSHFDHVFDLSQNTCPSSFDNNTRTKTVRWLCESCHLTPIWDLLGYSIHVGRKAEERVRRCLQGLKLSAERFVVINYQRDSAQVEKIVWSEDTWRICRFLKDNGIVPLFLERDRQNSMSSARDAFRPRVQDQFSVGHTIDDAETLAALIGKARALVAIDSDLQKIGFATKTSVIAVWTDSHPFLSADNTPNAIHLLPEDNVAMIRGCTEKTLEFCGGHYRTVTYRRDKLTDAIIVELAKSLEVPSTPVPKPPVFRATGYAAEYYWEHKVSDRDYLEHGEREEDYGFWLVDALQLDGKSVLDVGCACGSIAFGLAKAGSVVVGCDVSEYMIELGKQHWLANNLYVCDAINLHLWRDESFNCVHCHQVAQHWKPHLVKFILQELYRVTKTGGVICLILETTESLGRQVPGPSALVDPMCSCIKPLNWWKESLTAAGWADGTDLYQSLMSYSSSYCRTLRSEMLVCRKNSAVLLEETAGDHSANSNHTALTLLNQSEQSTDSGSVQGILSPNGQAERPPIVWYGERPAGGSNCQPKTRVLLMREGGVGDVLMLTAVAYDFIRENKNCAVSFQTEHPEVFTSNPEIVPFREGERYDRIIDFNWIAECQGIGKGTCSLDKYMTVSRMDLFYEAAGLVAVQPKPVYRVGPAERLWAAGQIHRPYIVYALHASSVYRTYPLEQSIEVLKLLAEKNEVAVVGQIEKQFGCKRAWQQFKSRNLVLDFNDKTTFAQMAALVANAQLVICPDSGILHLTAALGVPCIALFGNIEPRLRIKYYPLVYPLVRKLQCSFCGDHPKLTNGLCPSYDALERQGAIGAKCMAAIEPRSIVELTNEICGMSQG
jgi:ADP-heptose:LPS heptosyltransferase/SAM-dependent methyltransferase